MMEGHLLLVNQIKINHTITQQVLQTQVIIIIHLSQVMLERDNIAVIYPLATILPLVLGLAT